MTIHTNNSPDDYPTEPAPEPTAAMTADLYAQRIKGNAERLEREAADLRAGTYPRLPGTPDMDPVTATTHARRKEEQAAELRAELAGMKVGA